MSLYSLLFLCDQTNNVIQLKMEENCGVPLRHVSQHTLLECTCYLQILKKHVNNNYLINF